MRWRTQNSHLHPVLHSKKPQRSHLDLKTMHTVPHSQPKGMALQTRRKRSLYRRGDL